MHFKLLLLSNESINLSTYHRIAIDIYHKKKSFTSDAYQHLLIYNKDNSTLL